MKKFVALFLTVALSLSSTSFASASYAVAQAVDVGFQDISTLFFFQEITGEVDASAMVVASLAQLIQSKTYENWAIDTESPAFICNLKGHSSLYFRIFYKAKHGGYLWANVSEDSSYCRTIIPSDSKLDQDAFFNTGDPYETPEQMTAYLDARGYTYYTVSPEALAEAQASLEAN